MEAESTESPIPTKPFEISDQLVCSNFEYSDQMEKAFVPSTSTVHSSTTNKLIYQFKHFYKWFRVVSHLIQMVGISKLIVFYFQFPLCCGRQGSRVTACKIILPLVLLFMVIDFVILFYATNDITNHWFLTIFIQVMTGAVTVVQLFESSMDLQAFELLYAGLLCTTFSYFHAIYSGRLGFGCCYTKSTTHKKCCLFCHSNYSYNCCTNPWGYNSMWTLKRFVVTSLVPLTIIFLLLFESALYLGLNRHVSWQGYYVFGGINNGYDWEGAGLAGSCANGYQLTSQAGNVYQYCDYSSDFVDDTVNPNHADICCEYNPNENTNNNDPLDLFLMTAYAENDCSGSVTSIVGYPLGHCVNTDPTSIMYTAFTSTTVMTTMYNTLNCSGIAQSSEPMPLLDCSTEGTVFSVGLMPSIAGELLRYGYGSRLAITINLIL